MARQQYADGLIAKSYRVADVYDKGTLNDVLIEGFDQLVRHSLQSY